MRMKLYLMRHGDYVADVLQTGGPLSDKGRNDITQIAKFIAPLHLSVTALFHSNKLRAQQTAELLKESIKATRGTQIHQKIAPNDEAKEFANEIIDADETIFVVSHLPFLARLVSVLVVGNEDCDLVTFEPGTVVALSQVETRRFTIDWVLTPQLFSA